MPKRNIYFQGNLNAPIEIEESNDLFIMRVHKQMDPQSVLLKALQIKELAEKIELLAAFPDSDVYVYQVKSEFGLSRDEIKNKVRADKSKNLQYIGSIFSYSNTGIYQIYTENIFLKFYDDVEQKWINRFLKQHKLANKRQMNFGEKVFFVEPIDSKNKGRDVFQYAEELLEDPKVQFCHPELITKLRSEDRNIYHQNNELKNIEKDWWLRRTGAFKSWDTSLGHHATIAVIDDGLEMLHPAFKDKIVDPIDMMAKDDYSKPIHRFNDMHGTACASVACSADQYSLGIAPEAAIMPIRITGLGSVLQSEAIYWAVNHGADVISCSWGPPDGLYHQKGNTNFVFPLPDHTRLAFEYAHKHGRNGLGTPIVFAAGNGNEPVKFDGYASSEHVFAISSINHKDQRTKYSDHGKPILCCFPSGDYELNNQKKVVDVTGLFVADQIGEKGYSSDNYYAYFSGTSASCPGVAGVIALVLSVNPNLDINSLKQLLIDSCEPLDNNKYNTYFGYGLLRADLAVEQAIYSKLKSTKMSQNLKKALSLHIGINKVGPDYYSNYVPELYGCINDMNSMNQLAKSIGYESLCLQDKDATKENIIKKIIQFGNQIIEDGILLITYAGHGAPIPDKNDDVSDADDRREGYDQSWVTYDGFLLDDELFHTFAQINKRIRIVLVSDSCHSQSMSRFAAFAYQPGTTYTRALDLNRVLDILSYNKTSPSKLRENIPERNTLTYKVYVKALSACTKVETAKEKDQRGLYTTSLIEQYHNIKNSRNMDYKGFVELIKSQLEGTQQPTVENSHHKSEAFDKQLPFDTAKVRLDNTSENTKTPIVTPPLDIPSDSKVKLFVETNELLIGEQTGDIESKSAEYKHVSRSQSAEEKGWDRAYEYMMKHSDEIDFVEPETLSKMYFSEEKAIESRDIGHYLDTYPNAEEFPDDNPVPFIWHLNEKHSQLRKANEKVFPEIKRNAKNTDRTDIVKIGHIDTGIIENHPVLPVNMECFPINLKMNTDGPIDTDKPFAIAEQQGHGNATLAILAGNWVDMQITDNHFQGYFGAIPYAKVLPIKISESVALLSGKYFAKAVNYAIDQGCDVITMSMAGLPSKVMAKAVNRAYEAGVVIVSAASNCFSKGAGILMPKRTLYPARYNRVIAAVGATVNDKPYLVRFHDDDESNDRAAGGRFMQTCYGPATALETSLAAYTPNISWFNKIEEKDNKTYYFVKSGGGTSSATPQIAAAAALYVQKHIKKLKTYKGNEAWKKAEIVRQALFKSADKTTSYNYIYGQGLLKANDALKYSPEDLEKEIGNKPAKKVPEKKKFLGGAIGLLLGRGLTSSKDESLEEKIHDMMITEINQLIYKDPKLFHFADDSDLDNENFKIERPELISGIIQSKYASDFLKSHLIGMSNRMGARNNATNEEFNNAVITGAFGDIQIKSRGLQYNIGAKRSYREEFDQIPFYIDEFEIDITKSRTLRSGANRSFEIELDDQYDSVMLVNKIFEEGEVCFWKYKDNIDKTETREISEAKNLYSFKLEELELGVNQRGLGSKLKKLLVKVFKWIKVKKPNKKTLINKLAERLGDDNYQIMVYDLKAESNSYKNGWKDIKMVGEDVFVDLINDKKDALLFLPGLFSKVQTGFDEFLDSPQYRKVLLKRHCRYIIGLNMPTVVHGIEENAKRINELLKNSFLKPKNCTVIARSRGGIVARYLFEDLWINNQTFKPLKNAPFQLGKLIMFGSPNQGTMMASSTNWKSLLNYNTNIAKITLGTIIPVIPKIMTIVKAIGMGFVKLPGINDLEEGSEVLNNLNKIKMNRENYFVFTSHYEPGRKILKRLFDELLVDRLIFKKEHNDGVSPVPGAIFTNDEIECEVTLNKDQYYIAGSEMQISHFAYLKPKHKELKEKLLEELV
ncbi:MAG: S8 family serine peptidase, partial [Bacteroidota bacterium]